MIETWGNGNPGVFILCDVNGLLKNKKKQKVKYKTQDSQHCGCEKMIDVEKKDSDSTVTSLDENTENFCTNPTRDILAEGIVNLFKPAVERLDESIRATRTTQAELKLQLDTLSSKLRSVEKAQHSIPEFSDKVKELINIKHKVTIITNILSASQERLTNLHRLIEKEQRRRQALLDSAISTNIS